MSIARSRYGSFMRELVGVHESSKWSLWFRDLHGLWWGRVGCLFRNMYLVLGNRRSINFWSDPYVDGRVVFKDRFPRLFFLSSKIEEFIRDIFSVDGKFWLFKWERFFT